MSADATRRQAAKQAANLAVVHRYAEAWRAGDRETLVACYHPDFTLHYFGANPRAGDHVGRPAALATLGEVARRTQRKLLDVVDVLAGPERGVVIARERFTRGDLTADLERVLVYAIRDDRLHQCWIYDADQRLVDRFLG